MPFLYFNNFTEQLVTAFSLNEVVINQIQKLNYR